MLTPIRPNFLPPCPGLKHSGNFDWYANKRLLGGGHDDGKSVGDDDGKCVDDDDAHGSSEDGNGDDIDQDDVLRELHQISVNQAAEAREPVEAPAAVQMEDEEPQGLLDEKEEALAEANDENDPPQNAVTRRQQALRRQIRRRRRIAGMWQTRQIRVKDIIALGYSRRMVKRWKDVPVDETDEAFTNKARGRPATKISSPEQLEKLWSIMEEDEFDGGARDARRESGCAQYESRRES